MNTALTCAFGLFGGLALFLFGMNEMSTSLQKAAGERMKRILSFLTDNPVKGVLAGALVTAILQSSSATTVMTIGFVSAGLMGLPQAISVIFGTNIGTTMTAQLIAFDISDYIYPIIAIGFALNAFGKKEQVRNVGMVIFSFGVLFDGIEIMGSAMEPLAASTVFTDLMAKVAVNPILGLLLGTGMTLLIQSSSATIAILQKFAATPGADGVSSIIGLSGAIPILLGNNIGTTITALLASARESTDAKRAAVSHSVFNITGSLVFIGFTPMYAKFIQMISPSGTEIAVISRQIANAHTVFNVVCTLAWLPLIPLMVKIVHVIVPDAKKKEETAQPGLSPNPRLVAQPSAALFLVKKDLSECFDMTRMLLSDLAKAPALSGETDNNAFAQTYSDLKMRLYALLHYMADMFSAGTLSQEQSEQTSLFYAYAQALDRIADRSGDIYAAAETISDKGASLSDNAMSELSQCIQDADRMVIRALEIAESDSESDIQEGVSGLRRAKQRLRSEIKRHSKSHLNRVKEGTCSEEHVSVYMGILGHIDRIGDNAVTIAEEALDANAFETQEYSENDLESSAA